MNNMLNKQAFANSLAVVTTLFYWVLIALWQIAPNFFEFVFNALYGGVEAFPLLLPPTATNLVGTWIVLLVTAWVLGYIWAWLYNKFLK